MENSSIPYAQPHPQQQHQRPQGQPALGRSAAPLVQPAQQLPPQMFTTAAQLLDLTDKKLMVALRDGRKLIGVLRSWDQFANLVLQNTVERIFARPNPAADGLYADIDRGVFLVRGENVLLLGEIDLDKDDDPPPGYVLADAELVHRLSEEQKDKDRNKDRVRLQKLASIGFEGENIGEILL